MESRWFQQVSERVATYDNPANKKLAKRLKLDLLRRVAGRIEEFSPVCPVCQPYRDELTVLTENLGNLMQFPAKEAVKAHTRQIDAIAAHLKKGHHLVSSGYYMSLFSGIGIGVGVALNALLDFGIGTVAGIALGFAVGGYLDRKARKEGRVL